MLNAETMSSEFLFIPVNTQHEHQTSQALLAVLQRAKDIWLSREIDVKSTVIIYRESSSLK